MATELSLHNPPCPQIISFGTRTIQQGTRALPVKTNHYHPTGRQNGFRDAELKQVCG
jgi:hypothetical protein